MVKYSICVTHHNNVVSLKESLDSILNQVDEKFELIIVDNLSDDGSLTILQDYAEKGEIKLIRKRCNRGQGRQLAFENSSGDYIISNIDMDNVFKPVLDELLQFYHSVCEGYLLLVISDPDPAVRGFQNVTIAPRDLIQDLGGWRNLQFAEDWDLWSRAAKVGLYRYVAFSFAESSPDYEKKENILRRLSFRYIKYLDMLRLGRNIFFRGERITISQNLVSFLSKIVSIFYESYGDPFNKTFELYDFQYRLPNPR